MRSFLLPGIAIVLTPSQQRSAISVVCNNLRFLLRPDAALKRLNGMEAFSDSAYFHRMHDLMWPLRIPEVLALLNEEEQSASSEFNRVFEALPWRPIESHPHISELPDDDLSPLTPIGRRLLRLLERHQRPVREISWWQRALAAIGRRGS